MNRRIAALTLAVVAALGLTACTGSPAPATSGSAPAGGAATADAQVEGRQSVAEACAVVQDTITSATEQFDQAASQDPSVVAEAMKTAAQNLGDAAAEVSNEEVAALLPDLQDMFTQVGAVMEALVQGDTSKLAELGELGTDFQETTQRLQELCAPE